MEAEEEEEDPKAKSKGKGKATAKGKGKGRAAAKRPAKKKSKQSREEVGANGPALLESPAASSDKPEQQGCCFCIHMNLMTSWFRTEKLSTA